MRGFIWHDCLRKLDKIQWLRLFFLNLHSSEEFPTISQTPWSFPVGHKISVQTKPPWQLRSLIQHTTGPSPSYQGTVPCIFLCNWKCRLHRSEFPLPLNFHFYDSTSSFFFPHTNWWKALGSRYLQIFGFDCEENANWSKHCLELRSSAFAVVGSIALATITVNYILISLPLLSRGIWCFWDPVSSLSRPWKQSGKGKKKTSSLKDSIIYLFIKERWEFS